MNNGSSLPSGVQQNRKQLFIAAASRQHAGLYVCSVSNAAGVDQDGTTLVVYCKPHQRYIVSSLIIVCPNNILIV